ncbi:NERD domain-containing protein [Microbacterium hominis]|uniref:NERD domain-containing protein n=1 Tax=Microbacterium hominis TaxID=162426 RepID=A0A2K9DEQ2_9MICO|nr:NERD domain-containing protein [Microbacterium hominis]
MASHVQGTVIGRAGRSVIADSRFGDVGKVGAVGEARTGRVLAQLAGRESGPTVIHDVRIPIPGFTANIDHVVISGRDVTLLDSKVWRAGFYWTLGGVTRRGMELAAHCDKKTLQTGVEGIGRMLRNMGVAAHFRRSVLVVWPGPGGVSPNLVLYRPRSTATVIGRDDQSTLRRIARLTGSRPGDPQVVSAISRIIYA